MNRLFADTFFFFAFLNADDSAHREASTFYDAFDGQLLTTEWILTELADGLVRSAPPSAGDGASRMKNPREAGGWESRESRGGDQTLAGAARWPLARR